MKKKCELVFTREFLKKLKRIDRQTQIRVMKELKVLEQNPRAGKQLVGRLSNLTSFRIGDYRIIYEISNSSIIIRTIGHRKKVYGN